MKRIINHMIARFNLFIVFLKVMLFIVFFPFLILFFDSIEVSDYRDSLIKELDEKLKKNNEDSIN